MNVLVAYASRHGGTAGIAESIGAVLRAHRCTVDVLPTDVAGDVAKYDAVVVGAALYTGRWVRGGPGFVRRHRELLLRRPVWLFSSGPLDDSATKTKIEPVPQVAKLIELVRARGHATFGGRLAPDTDGFLAKRMAKTRAGDWRDDAQVKAWATDVAAALVTAPAEDVAA